MTDTRSSPGMATALVEFFRWAMREGPWDGCDLDGAAVQDKAESLGLIVKTQYDAEKHGVQSEFEHGDDWFEYAPGLLGAAQRQPETLATALQKCSGALGTFPEKLKIAFTGDWAHLGSATIGEILDEANHALSAVPPSPVAGGLDIDHPDCITARECELYDALMGLASHACSHHDDYQQWTQGGVMLEPIVSKALRLLGSSVPSTDGGTP